MNMHLNDDKELKLYVRGSQPGRILTENISDFQGIKTTHWQT